MWVGLGIVLRDAVGKLLMIGVKRIEPTNLEIASAEAVKYGMLLAQRMGFKKILVESGLMQ